MEHLTPVKIATLTVIYIFVGFLCAVLIGDSATGLLSDTKLGKKVQGYILLATPFFWPVIMLTFLCRMVLDTYLKELLNKFS